MNIHVETYLSSLLSFMPSRENQGRLTRDYLCLIHVPVRGGEQVYMLSLRPENLLLTTGKFSEAVWPALVDTGESNAELPGTVEVRQAVLSYEHPGFGFLTGDLMESLGGHSQGAPGQDYYLLLWRIGANEGSLESWEPYGRLDQPWMRFISIMQVLARETAPYPRDSRRSVSVPVPAMADA